MLRSLAILLLATSALAADVEGLGFLAGEWSGEMWGGEFRAYYSTPEGGRVLGHSRLLKDGSEAFYEFELFHVVDGKVVVQPFPGGRKAAPLTLTKLEGERAVFENAEKDYPTRIVYECPEPGTLRITLDDPHGDSDKREVFELERILPAPKEPELAMDLETFWSWIDRSREASEGNEGKQVKWLQTELAKLPPEEIAAFDHHFCQQRKASYRWDLWAAAYLIHGGCSDDGFDYFRGWLIAQGRKVFEATLEHPDSLAAVLPEGRPFLENESILYVASDAHEKATGGEELPDNGIHWIDPEGEEFDFDDDDEMKRRFPRLWKRIREE